MRKPALYIMFLGIVILFTCSSSIRVQKENTCDKDLELFIQNYWIYDTNGIVLLYELKTQKFCSEMLPENKCLMGKNKEEIKQLFGEPHMIRLGKFMYYTIGTCFAENSKYCAYIHFDFDENGIYKTIGVSGWSKSH